MAALLFAMLDFVTEMRNSDCCTNKTHVWHWPKRATKRATKPLVVGKRKVWKHLFARTVVRKRPLEDYKDYHSIDKEVVPDTEHMFNDIKKLEIEHHCMGLRHILDDSTDTASSEEGDNSEVISFTPDEIVLQHLQVTADEQCHIEQSTVGQHLNPQWLKQRCGRLTVSKAERYCGKGIPSLLL